MNSTNKGCHGAQRISMDVQEKLASCVCLSICMFLLQPHLKHGLPLSSSGAVRLVYVRKQCILAAHIG